MATSASPALFESVKAYYPDLPSGNGRRSDLAGLRAGAAVVAELPGAVVAPGEDAAVADGERVQVA